MALRGPAARVVCIAFILWAALAHEYPTALGRQVQTTGLLVAIAVFGIANPFSISEVGASESRSPRHPPCCTPSFVDLSAIL